MLKKEEILQEIKDLIESDKLKSEYIKSLEEELKIFYNLFSDYESTCTTTTTAVRIWNNMRQKDLQQKHEIITLQNRLIKAQNTIDELNQRWVDNNIW